MLQAFQTYPFEKLSLLLKDITPPAQEIIDLTIGEPHFDTPLPIQNALKDSTSLLNRYPKSKGEIFLKKAQIDFVAKRFGVHLSSDQIIPTLGTREVLFNFPQFFLFDEPNPCIAYPNPFYQIYEGASIASKAETILMDLTTQNHFRPILSNEELKRVQLVILNSPNNPTGSTLSLDELICWVKLALEYDFVILSDECYSEIYEKTPPHSILEASIQANNPTFKNILALNSISKRSSCPGLRSGFIAGDETILKTYGLYRTYTGCAIPLPIQKASQVAWELPSETTRILYAQNLQLAREILDIPISPYSFYVWLQVSDDLTFTRFLYQNYGIKVLPGSFLGKKNGGKDFVRIALVYEPLIIAKVLQKIKHALKNYYSKSSQ